MLYFKLLEGANTKEDKHSILPKIAIEPYLKENELFTEFLGNNNSLKLRQQGLKCIIRFDEKFQSENVFFYYKKGLKGSTFIKRINKN